MKTPPRALGTRQETAVVNQAQQHGLHAERLPEAGTNDQGDVRITTNHEWILEVKDRQQLNIHQTLEKALTKSGTPHTAVAWRRMTRKPGNTNRSQQGPIIIAMTLDRFLQLLKETVDP